VGDRLTGEGCPPADWSDTPPPYGTLGGPGASFLEPARERWSERSAASCGWPASTERLLTLLQPAADPARY
jgi:hypothetical protein